VVKFLSYRSFMVLRRHAGGPRAASLRREFLSDH